MVNIKNRLGLGMFCSTSQLRMLFDFVEYNYVIIFIELDRISKLVEIITFRYVLDHELYNFHIIRNYYNQIYVHPYFHCSQRIVKYFNWAMKKFSYKMG